jgi:hypothetical protein
MPLNKQLTNELMGFAGLSACAGIRNAPKQARKAKGNHYGEFMTEDGATYMVPVRQYIWAATHNRPDKAYAEEIKRLIFFIKQKL